MDDVSDYALFIMFFTGLGLMLADTACIAWGVVHWRWCIEHWVVPIIFLRAAFLAVAWVASTATELKKRYPNGRYP